VAAGAPPRLDSARARRYRPAVPEAPAPSHDPPPLRTGDFDFALPERLIAQEPARPRDAARLLLVRGAAVGAGGVALEDLGIRDLPGLLRPGDLLVANDTRVIPARLRGRRGAAAIEILLNRAEGGGVWQALVRNARRLSPGDLVEIDGAPELRVEVREKSPDGSLRLHLAVPLEVPGARPPGEATAEAEAALLAVLERAGEIPLPPYIARPDGPRPSDREDYQTIFAAKPGAVAAPTASLHITPGLLTALAARGVARTSVTLHVGAGTFLPLRSHGPDDDPRAQRLHAEWGEITPGAAAAINTARAAGGRIVALGTTALRLLEAAATGDAAAPVRPFRGETDIFLLPGHRFTTADLLLTNFHLPRSSLFMLVSAFAGTATMRAAYAHAIAAEYRFYSYGDASLLARGEMAA
jgi:S-adenosylmethionine:tRNA ribosyltransferase-isomerase